MFDSTNQPPLAMKKTYGQTLRRYLEMIPGLLFWTLVLTTLLVSRHHPNLALGIGIIFAVYLLIRTIYTINYGEIGFTLIKKWQATDWIETWKHKLPLTHSTITPEDVRHIVIIPNYSESVEVLEQTLLALKKQTAASRLWVILAMEAREQGGEEKAQKLIGQFKSAFAGLFCTVHPAGLPGEMACKGTNETWATRWAYHHLVNTLQFDIRTMMVTICDADSRLDPQYFACLSYLFATNPERYLRFWQAPLLYHNNVWETPGFIRVISSISELYQLGQLADPHQRALTFSTYSTSLLLLAKNNYWDPDVISEDWHIFLKAYYQQRGKVKLEPIMLPTTGNDTRSHSIFATMRNRYVQSKRHAWGVSDCVYALLKSIEHPEIPMEEKGSQLWNIWSDHIIWSSAWFVIVFSGAIPLLWEESWFTSALYRQLQLALTALLTTNSILTVFLIALEWRIRPPAPQAHRKRLLLMELVQWMIAPVFMLILAVIPSVEAHTRLMLGRPLLEFKVTEKFNGN
jgi:hypothetical protein